VIRASAIRIRKGGGRAEAICADVNDRDAMVRAFDAAERALGTVDILVNNAGIAHRNRVTDLPPEEWRRAKAERSSTSRRSRASR
jgi:NAD(P)-dependent dehydrogenase (short-subunit alcohol dehydrogenase family)